MHYELFRHNKHRNYYISETLSFYIIIYNVYNIYIFFFRRLYIARYAFKYKTYYKILRVIVGTFKKITSIE